MDDDDAIAIIGIGCKFPGADNQDEFWQLLVNGENHVIDIPPERWNNDAFYNSDPDAKGKTYVPRAGFLRNHDEFDNKLFGINDIEAERMDPQQRYVLECVHMALEDGGITRNMISGSNTGVFIGFMNDDYKGSAADDLTTMTNYSLTGTSPSIISARVSYVYNLLGPSMSIDTACSSALVAIDVAAQSLKMVIGQFMKQTTHGWDHQVTLSVKENENGRSFNWGFQEKTMTKFVSINDIEKVETSETNGKYYIRIHANHRLYIFKTADPKLFEQFTYELTHTDCDFSGVMKNESLLF